MIHQLNMFGEDKVQTAIKRLKTFEPPEGYYLAFSGGKDSVTVKALMDMAGVKYDAHYAITSVDPPELVEFVKTFPDVKREQRTFTSGEYEGRPITMWNLIPLKKMPPTRIVRYCCAKLKEKEGAGRFVVTGVRKAESVKRSKRAGLELAERKSHRMTNYDPDNPDQELIHICHNMARKHLNPIIDWTTEDVWEFIREYNVPYCRLYDEGFTRLGCIGCPMGGGDQQRREFERWPKYKENYLKAFGRMIKARERHGMKIDKIFQTPEDVMAWWLGERDWREAEA